MQFDLSNLSIKILLSERDCPTYHFGVNGNLVKDLVVDVIEEGDSCYHTSTGIVDTDFQRYFDTFNTGKAPIDAGDVESKRVGYVPLLNLCSCCDVTCGGIWTNVSIEGELVTWENIFFWNPSFLIGPEIIVEQNFIFSKAEYQSVFRGL